MKQLLIISILIFGGSHYAVAGGASSIEGDYFLLYTPLVLLAVMLGLEYLWKLFKSRNVWHRFINFLQHQFQLLKHH